MTTRVLVKPVEGRLVRVPGSYQALPAEGKVVESNSYWIRKRQAGDVTIGEELVPSAKETKGEGK